MPGVHLNDTERRLQARWDNNNYGYINLKRIQIDGVTGLRGIKNLTVDFRYPLTVISGRNGSGKSTILALAALAFHAAPGHAPLNALRPVKEGEDSTYYTFRDFFCRGPGDPDITGLEIKWTYQSRESIRPVSAKKQSRQWMRYESRPPRPVHYLGIGRAVPAIERTVLRNHFPPDKPGTKGFRVVSDTLTSEYRRRLADIMGRPYEDAVVHTSRKHTLRSVRAGSNYSSFNMGAGEDVLANLMFVLQETPRGALIVIEEVESGLHPLALTKLAKHLQEIMAEREFQIVVSTHSESFIDAVPRQARLLVERRGDKHHVVAAPTTRLAVGAMSERPSPELHVYCEDHFARQLIELSLTVQVRRRCNIIPVGSKAELCNIAKSHEIVNDHTRCLVVWDGDVTEREINEWKRSSGLDDSFLWIQLPGSVPERWVVDTLDSVEGYQALARELNGLSEPEAHECINRLKAADPKRIVRELAVQFGIEDEREAQGALIRAVASLGHPDLNALAGAIKRVLDGASDAVDEVAAVAQ